ncbi:MAG TPA: BON domain-containing protein [Thermoanaerobaculia bacterium]|nr:BON domain-containing protein [Thermoanaerobaculia bacterium]
MIRKTTAMMLGAGAALGAGLMYLLDPAEGRRRRALAKDKATRYGRETGRAATRTGRDVLNRARGTAHEAGSKLRKERVPDGVLVDRVRAEMGHVVDDPSGVVVTARGGHVTLAGALPEEQMKRLLERVASTPGVAGVESQLNAGDGGLH